MLKVIYHDESIRIEQNGEFVAYLDCPEDIQPEDICELVETAYKLGCEDMKTRICNSISY